MQQLTEAQTALVLAVFPAAREIANERGFDHLEDGCIRNALEFEARWQDTEAEMLEMWQRELDEYDADSRASARESSFA
jgi:hypothetical protein